MLIDDAIQIIEQKDIGIADIEKLSKILVHLSIEQGKYGVLSATQECEYRLMKTTLIQNSIKTGLPYNKSENMALSIVEKKFGEYRINKEKSKKFASICNRIENHIKLALHKNKLNILAFDASLEDKL